MKKDTNRCMNKLEKLLHLLKKLFVLVNFVNFFLEFSK